MSTRISRGDMCAGRWRSSVEQHIRVKGWSQTEATRRLGVTQPRISDLLLGKINLFGPDSLVNIATAAGLHVEMQVHELKPA
ncbi:helix-turn-helix domain-containing protein [Chelativorans composti]|uniref:Helix-turn-helix domain-containing protein n=2 Tax=Chelativorans composti TaxID=768533 RepID=A0ABW5DDM8_9HYPH